MGIEELIKILLEYKPSIKLEEKKEELFELIKELKVCYKFNQNSKWHPYDVFEHILHVIDNTEPTITQRLTALFHDIGKPIVYEEDEFKRGHFRNHWIKSSEIFNKFAKENNLDEDLTNKVSKLIYFHDYNFDKLSEEELKTVIGLFTKEEIVELYKFKKADLLAQNSEYYYLLEDYDKQKEKILLKYE